MSEWCTRFSKLEQYCCLECIQGVSEIHLRNISYICNKHPSNSLKWIQESLRRCISELAPNNFHRCVSERHFWKNKDMCLIYEDGCNFNCVRKCISNTIRIFLNFKKCGINSIEWEEYFLYEYIFLNSLLLTWIECTNNHGKHSKVLNVFFLKKLLVDPSILYDD